MFLVGSTPLHASVRAVCFARGSSDDLASFPLGRKILLTPYSRSGSSSSAPSPSSFSSLALPSTQSIYSFASEICDKRPSLMTNRATPRRPLPVDMISCYWFVPAASLCIQVFFLCFRPPACFCSIHNLIEHKSPSLRSTSQLSRSSLLLI